MSAADKYGSPKPRINTKTLEQIKQAGEMLQQHGVAGGKETTQPNGPQHTPSVADKYGSPNARGRDITQEKGRQMER